MYAVTMIQRTTKKVIELLGFANNEDEVNELIDRCCRQHGADWIGSNGYDFAVELAI